jgi:hypothetical protein
LGFIVLATPLLCTLAVRTGPGARSPRLKIAWNTTVIGARRWQLGRWRGRRARPSPLLLPFRSNVDPAVPDARHTGAASIQPDRLTVVTLFPIRGFEHALPGAAYLSAASMDLVYQAHGPDHLAAGRTGRARSQPLVNGHSRPPSAGRMNVCQTDCRIVPRPMAGLGVGLPPLCQAGL